MCSSAESEKAMEAARDKYRKAERAAAAEYSKAQQAAWDEYKSAWDEYKKDGHDDDHLPVSRRTTCRPQSVR
jgi:hypothetical protein